MAPPREDTSPTVTDDDLTTTTCSGFSRAAGQVPSPSSADSDDAHRPDTAFYSGGGQERLLWPSLPTSSRLPDPPGARSTTLSSSLLAQPPTPQTQGLPTTSSPFPSTCVGPRPSDENSHLSAASMSREDGSRQQQQTTIMDGKALQLHEQESNPCDWGEGRMQFDTTQLTFKCPGPISNASCSEIMGLANKTPETEDIGQTRRMDEDRNHRFLRFAASTTRVDADAAGRCQGRCNFLKTFSQAFTKCLRSRYSQKEGFSDIKNEIRDQCVEVSRRNSFEMEDVRKHVEGRIAVLEQMVQTNTAHTSDQNLRCRQEFVSLLQDLREHVQTQPMWASEMRRETLNLHGETNNLKEMVAAVRKSSISPPWLEEVHDLTTNVNSTRTKVDQFAENMASQMESLKKPTDNTNQQLPDLQETLRRSVAELGDQHMQHLTEFFQKQSSTKLRTARSHARTRRRCSSDLSNSSQREFPGTHDDADTHERKDAVGTNIRGANVRTDESSEHGSCYHDIGLDDGTILSETDPGHEVPQSATSSMCGVSSRRTSTRHLANYSNCGDADALKRRGKRPTSATKTQRSEHRRRGSGAVRKVGRRSASTFGTSAAFSASDAVSNERVADSGKSIRSGRKSDTARRSKGSVPGDDLSADALESRNPVGWQTPLNEVAFCPGPLPFESWNHCSMEREGHRSEQLVGVMRTGSCGASACSSPTYSPNWPSHIRTPPLENSDTEFAFK